MTKTMLCILKVLEKHRDAVMGSRELSRHLKAHGIELTERTVRYHLKIMDEQGLTQVFGKEGRRITDLGLQELASSHVSDRVGFIISKIETLAFLTGLDLDRRAGEIIMNVSCFPEDRLGEAVEVMRPVFGSPYVMSDLVAVVRGGGKIGEIPVPEGMIGLATVCSVTINGMFLKAGIPVVSRYGGVLQVDETGPVRFVALIGYEGSSLDPHQVFIKGRMTSVSDAVQGQGGAVLASFREIPVVSLGQATRLRDRLGEMGLGGIIHMGSPNQPTLEVPVGLDRVGMVVVGGLNPVAALEERGIETESSAMSVLMEYGALVPFEEAMATL